MSFDFHPSSAKMQKGREANTNKPRRHASVERRPSKVLVGAGPIAAFMFNDPSMSRVVKRLADSGELGHHYRKGILCSTPTACKLGLARLHRKVSAMGGAHD